MATAAAKKQETQTAPKKPVANDTLADQQARLRSKFINDPQFKLAEQYRQFWIATIPADHTLEDAMRPEYWRNVASKIRHYDHIECYAETGAFYAELLVVGKAMNSVKTVPIVHVDLNAAMGTIDMGEELKSYEIRFGGPTNGFRVIHKPANAVIKERLMSEDEARSWLIDYIRRPDKGFVEDRPGSEPMGEVAQPDSSAAKLASAAAARRPGANA